MPLVVVPQILLCGLLAPRYSLPKVLNWISDALPLSYATDSFTELANSDVLVQHPRAQPRHPRRLLCRSHRSRLTNAEAPHPVTAPRRTRTTERRLRRRHESRQSSTQHVPSSRPRVSPARQCGRSRHDAGVDASLISHHFGDKYRVLVATMQLPVNPVEKVASVVEGGPDGHGRATVAYVPRSVGSASRCFQRDGPYDARCDGQRPMLQVARNIRPDHVAVERARGRRW